MFVPAFGALHAKTSAFLFSCMILSYKFMQERRETFVLACGATRKHVSQTSPFFLVWTRVIGSWKTEGRYLTLRAGLQEQTPPFCLEWTRVIGSSKKEGRHFLLASRATRTNLSLHARTNFSLHAQMSPFFYVWTRYFIMQERRETFVHVCRDTGQMSPFMQEQMSFFFLAWTSNWFASAHLFHTLYLYF